ncbi:type VI secretion system Vgr family protein [Massilia niastensis]|uniref:type VI secretion system Vgr family protein n=1 Tax=Massilia niastensis TaxID=544911 RepID=UPI00036E7B60|nr:type VI secretion system Vgr family protein [Massilia niastensis]
MKALPDLASLGLFGTGLSQHARLVTLASAQPGGLPDSLAAEQFTGREAVNELFRFDVDALSTSTDLDLSLFIGEELTLGLLQPDGARRAWHGTCTAASWLGADGGVARYRLRLEPALALLALRRDSHVFQDRNARDIVTELLADYPQVRFDFDLTQALAARPIYTQYRESDLDFFIRLLASEGLNWRFEHDQAEGRGGAGHGQARHRLVIFDSRALAPRMPGGEVIRFHGVRATERDDAIDAFRARRSVQANAVTISSWDPAQLFAPGAEQHSHLDAGELPAMQVYDGSGERIASDSAAARTHSELMLQALELHNKVFEGDGAVRRLAAGCAFQLTQHDRYPEGDNAFKVLWVRHEARNTFRTGIAGATGAGVDNGTYRNSFACVRETVALVPRATAAPHPRSAPGPQTALVVGLPGAVSTTTRDHQVKVQFPWQRGLAANPGGMAHDLDAQGNAPGNDASGAWVRVAEALAGPNWGTVFTPRIGTEVLVDFIEGDIDRPVVVAQLYTGSDLPPFAAGVDSGADHPGVLSGIHTVNVDGGGYNQWVLDDSTGQLRMRLASSSADSQLNLGYLVQQSPHSAQRGAYRGSGFELRTDAWGVLRGGEGVLLSTHARPGLGSGITSTQIDVAEALASFKAAQALNGTLGDAATQQQALFSKDAARALEELIERIDPKAKGSYEGAVDGQAALKAGSGSRELDPEQPVEKFGAALVLMDSAAGINWATPASTVIYAGQQLHWSTQSDLHMAAAHTVSAVAGNAASFFTHAGGIQAIAANGPVSLQAHTDQLEILADQEITVISVNDRIEIKAREKIVLQAGQSAITLEGGNITFACPGKFTVKGGQHVFDKGARKAADLRSLPGEPEEEAQHWIALNYVDAELGEGIPDAEYEIHFKGGPVISGTLDKDGKALHENIADKPVAKVIYKPRKPQKETPHDPLQSLIR